MLTIAPDYCAAENCTDRLASKPYLSPYWYCCGLLSLFDMLEHSASAFADIFHALSALRERVARPDIAKSRLTADLVEEGPFAEQLQKLEIECKRLDLIVTLKLLKAIVKDIDQYDGQYLAERLGQLQERAVDELDSKLFLFVPSADASYYRDKVLFGSEVDSKFPQVAQDITEAGKCRSLDRHTATVFHLMRVLEAGVAQFASKLAVAIGPTETWGNILAKVDGTIKTLPKVTPQEREHREICQGLYSGLNAIKDAWRNPTMHAIASSYTAQEAREIWDLTSHFMRRLCKII